MKALGVLILKALVCTVFWVAGFAISEALGITNWAAFLFLAPALAILEHHLAPEKFSLLKVITQFGIYSVLAFAADLIWKFGSDPLFIIPIFTVAVYLTNKFLPTRYRENTQHSNETTR